MLIIFGSVYFLVFFKEVEISFLPSLDNKGGGIMDYVTWHDMIELAMLVFTIISCFYNKKR